MGGLVDTHFYSISRTLHGNTTDPLEFHAFCLQWWHSWVSCEKSLYCKRRKFNFD